MKLRHAVLALALLFAPQVASAQSNEDGVRSAVEDYVEALYQVDPSRIERSVSKELVKFGYWKPDASQEYGGSPMTYDQLHRLASGWNRDNRNKIDESTPKEIVIFDVLDKTAVAKLTAFWGIDYFQLEKIDGKWMIRHILWQSHPE